MPNILRNEYLSTVLVFVVSVRIIFVSGQPTDISNPAETPFGCEKMLAEFDALTEYISTPERERTFVLGVLPGIGWDNLRNLPMSLVSKRPYKHCKLVNNDMFLVPDNVYFTANKKSDITTIADVIDSSSDYKSATSSSINLESGISFEKGKIDGKFSRSYKYAKSLEKGKKLSVTRVQIRHNFYIASITPNSKLHPPFKRRVLNLALHVQNNDTAMAKYLSQTLIRDYGTHHVTSVQAGAMLAKEDYITSDFAKELEESNVSLSAMAGASFLSVFGINGGFGEKVDNSIVDKYESSLSFSGVYSKGGPPTTTSFDISDWTTNLDTNLVAIDRVGLPLDTVINVFTLPELSGILIDGTTSAIKNAIFDYYRFNTHPGCTSPESPYYDRRANVDDGTCFAQTFNFTLGGLYQTCESDDVRACSDLVYRNTLTNKNNCPQGYTSVLLYKNTLYRSREVAYFKPKYEKRIENYTMEIETHWCVNLGKDGKSVTMGLLFGGTRDKNKFDYTIVRTSDICPPTYEPYAIGDKVLICLANMSSAAQLNSVTFAGFFSCQVGNPLSSRYTAMSDAREWPAKCPSGYSMHLAGFVDSCYIEYCAKHVRIEDIGTINRPPHVQQPQTTHEKDFLIGRNNQKIIKNIQTGDWENEKYQPQVDSKLRKSNKQVKDSSTNIGTKIGLGVFAGVVGIAIIIIAIAFFKKKSGENKITSVGATANSQL